MLWVELLTAIIKNWIMSYFFPAAISCPRGAYYAECTPPCEVTCQSINSQEAQECVQSQCVPGCKCPAGMVLHDFECISISDCPEQWMQQSSTG